MNRLRAFLANGLVQAARTVAGPNVPGQRTDASAFGRCLNFPDSIKKPATLSLSRRMNIYLSHLSAVQSAHFDVTPRAQAYPVSVHTTLDDFISLHARKHARDSEMTEKQVAHYTHIYKRYAVDFQAVLAEARIEDPLLLVYGDNILSRPLPVAVKSRPAYYGSLACIVPIGRDRHFAPIADAEAVDIPFERKKDRLVWRGTNTGSFVDSPFRPLGGRAHISRLVAEDPDMRFDVGYSTLGPLTPIISPEYMALLQNAQKPKLNYKNQLKYKYILVLEGNDTATGLKWVMNSNSLAIMPHPQSTTWVCEHFLEPFVHYIPVRRDLSDLSEVLDWCDAHQDFCLEIIQNAKDFIAVFRDDDEQRALGAKVLKEIARRTTFTYPY